MLIGPLEPLLYPSTVSIVVPCYNCGEFVLLAFESFERSFDVLQDLVLRLGTRSTPPTKRPIHAILRLAAPSVSDVRWKRPHTKKHQHRGDVVAHVYFDAGR